MDDLKKLKIALGIAAAFVLLGLAMFAATVASAQDHPAFGTHHVSQLIVTSDVPDVPKLEAKAVEILRRVGTVTGETMTLAEARAKVRIDGKTDVARCLEIVIIDRLRGIAQARVVGTTVANEHPVQGGAQ